MGIFTIVFIFLLETSSVYSNIKPAIKEKKNKQAHSTIHVTASRDESKNPVESPESISISDDKNKIENYLSDILNKQAGVTLNRYGAPGSFSELSLRGNYAHQTNIYINGILLNDALGGFVNIEELPIDLFNKAELYHSYVPIHLPGNNIGGALDLLPRFARKKEKKLFFRLFGHSLYGGGLGLGFSDTRQIHLAHFEGSLNRYDYLDNNGTRLINLEDDTIRTRENEDYLQGSYNSIFNIPFSKGGLKIFLAYLGKERGLPGQSGLPLRQVRYETHRLILKPSLDYIFSKYFILNASAGFTGQYSYLEDNADELLFLRSEQARYFLRAQGSLKPILFLFSEKLTVYGSVFYAYNQLYLEEEILGNRSQIEAGVSAKYEPLSWLGSISGGGKYSNLSDTPGEVYQSILFVQPLLDTKVTHLFSGQVRLSLYPLSIFNKIAGTKKQSILKAKKKGKYLELFVMTSYSERSPSLSELYGDGAFLLPNSELAKENSITYTVGAHGFIRCKIVSCSFKIAYFNSPAENLILLINNSQRTAKYFNISSSISNGVEFDFKLKYAQYFLLDIGASYLRAVDNSNIPFYQGKFLPFKPIFTLNSYLEGGFFDIRSFINITWQGQVYRDRFNQEANLIPQRFLMDTGLIYDFPKSKDYSIIFKVKNVLGRFQSDVLGYPLAGRYFEIKMTGKILL